MLTLWKKMDDLKSRPELAGTPGYELEELYAEEPVSWFLLLMEQPRLAPPADWWFQLRNRCDLPWARLLAACPQFKEFCNWESVSRAELVKLAFLAPELFSRKFRQGRWQDLYAFLMPRELAGVLMDVPGMEQHLEMDEVNEKLDDSMWLDVLACQPHLEQFFDWARVENKPCWSWDFLLRRQPQFAGHCDFSQLTSAQLRRILGKQPRFADRVDWSKLKPSDRKKLEEKGIKP